MADTVAPAMTVVANEMTDWLAAAVPETRSLTAAMLHLADSTLMVAKLTPGAGSALKLSGGADAIQRRINKIRAEAFGPQEEPKPSGELPGEGEDAAGGDSRQESLDKYIESLQKQIDTYDMTASELRLYEAEAMGATAAEMDAVRAHNAMIESLELETQEHDKLRKAQEESEQQRKREQEKWGQLRQREDEQWEQFGKSLEDSLRTPLEKYEQQINKLDEALARGSIGWELYDRAVADAQKTLESDEKALQRATDRDRQRTRSIGTVGALQRGSAEAFSVVNRANLDGMRNVEKHTRSSAETLKRIERVIDLPAATQEINVIQAFS